MKPAKKCVSGQVMFYSEFPRDVLFKKLSGFLQEIYLTRFSPVTAGITLDLTLFTIIYIFAQIKKRSLPFEKVTNTDKL